MKIVFLIASLFFAACGMPTDDSSSSKVMWGALDGHPASLLSVKSVLFCGSNEELKAMAINAYFEWTAQVPARRAVAWKSVKCVSGYEATIDLGVDSACQKNVVGWHTNRGQYHTIRICKGYEYAMRNNMLHELGHAFGLCDAYRPGVSGPAFHDNCDSPRSRYAAISVMNSLSSRSPTALTADDVAGIKAMDKLYLAR